MRYQHTQFSRIFIALLTVMFGFITLMLLLNLSEELWGTALIIIVFFVVANFASLTVSVDSSHVRIKFGYGIFKKSFALKDISSAKAEKHPWWNGWGIRMWIFPYRWTYNVAGFDVIELVMKNGRIFRIGTDEPEKLLPAIQEAMKQWDK